MFAPSEFDIASWRRSFQLSDLTSLIASVASRQASIQSWWFWWIVRRRRFRVQILASMCGVIQGLDLLLGFDFPTWLFVAEMRISLKQATWISWVHEGDCSFSIRLRLWNRTNLCHFYAIEQILVWWACNRFWFRFTSIMIGRWPSCQ